MIIGLMNKVAIYPGTFDPITFGHIDVIKKGLKLLIKLLLLFQMWIKKIIYLTRRKNEIVKMLIL